MSAAAVIVGIDAYRDHPLTSAVRDALAFSDAIVELGLVEPGSITLLTAPAQPGALQATRDEVTAALRRLYISGDDIDRMYVYFSGHGMQVPVGGSHSMSATAFLPADVVDPIAEPWKLLNIDSLVQTFRTAGPREQCFFIDACRDLVYDQYPPDLPSIGLGGRSAPPVGVRGQAALYAVSPGGQALGVRDGLGVMTGHLIKALHGEGEALDYDDALDSYVVTMHSVYAYVRARVDQEVRALPGWQRQYMLPDPMSAGPPLTAIRVVPDPRPASLTLTVDPPGDAQWVHVALLQRGTRLAEPLWPPAPFGAPVPVPPQRFRLSAGSNVGATGVDPELIDARTTTSACVRHQYIGILGPGPVLRPPPIAPPGDPGPGPALVAYSPESRRMRGGDLIRVAEALSKPVGVLRAVAEEPWAIADVAGLQPPYAERSGRAGTEFSLPAGHYQVQFRVGSQTFSRAEAEIDDGRLTTVDATAAASPLVASVTRAAIHPSFVTLSERMGPVQANPALSLVSLIALGINHRDGNRPEPAEGRASGRSVSLAVAVDGTLWPVPAAEVAAGIRAELKFPGQAWRPVSLAPAEAAPHADAGAPGLDQIVCAAVDVRSDGLMLAVRSAQAGDIELAVAAVAGGVTSVAIVARADGAIDVAQFISASGRDETPIAPRARYALLGQWLYESDELIDYGLDSGSDELRAVLTGTAVNPVLSAMAFHAWSDFLASGDSDRESLRRQDAAGFRDQVGHGLIEAFPSAPDAIVIAALLDKGQRYRIGDLAGEGPAPILARSVRAGAALRGDPEMPLARLARRVVPDSVWTLRRAQPDAEAGLDI